MQTSSNHKSAITVTMHSVYRNLAPILGLITLMCPGLSHAYHLPLWDFGLGLGTLQAPHYRGSKTVETYTLPVPYASYRGDLLKIDREEGIRSEIFSHGNWHIRLSLGGSVPVPESDDSARAGMPSLDPLIELGPALNVRLWHDNTGKSKLDFHLPLRAVLSVGEPILDPQGWISSPGIKYTKKFHDKDILWRFSSTVGPIYGSRKYHAYFYDVDSNYSNNNRPVFHADSGYSGSRLTLTLARNTKKWFLGILARYDTIDNAVFEDSPLVETSNYFIVGVAFAYIFASSSEMAPHQNGKQSDPHH